MEVSALTALTSYIHIRFIRIKTTTYINNFLCRYGVCPSPWYCDKNWLVLAEIVPAQSGWAILVAGAGYNRCSPVICVMIRGDLDPILREKRGIGEEQIFCHILHTNGPDLIEFLNTWASVSTWRGKITIHQSSFNFVILYQLCCLCLFYNNSWAQNLLATCHF